MDCACLVHKIYGYCHSRICLTRHRLIRYFFVGPGGDPTFCVHFCSSNSAMSNPNGLLSQKLCHYLNQGRTLNDILMRAAHGMAYFDLSKLNFA